MSKPDLVFRTRDNADRLAAATAAARCEKCQTITIGPHDCPGAPVTEETKECENSSA